MTPDELQHYGTGGKAAHDHDQMFSELYDNIEKARSALEQLEKDMFALIDVTFTKLEHEGIAIKTTDLKNTISDALSECVYTVKKQTEDAILSHEPLCDSD